VLKASSCSIPLCATCQYDKAHLHSKPGAVEVKEIAHDGILWAEHTTPSHFSADQFISSTKGHLLHGKEKEDKCYTGSTLYVDEASSMVFCILQVSLNVAEMLHGKHLVKREALNCGVEVRTYHGDNDVF